MSETKEDSGVIKEYNIDPQSGRITFVLNKKTYALFERNKDGSPNETATKAKEIFMQNAKSPIKIGYFEVNKEGKTYRNVTSIEMGEAPQEVVEEEVKPDREDNIRRLALLKVAATALSGSKTTIPTPEKLIEYAKRLEELLW